MLIGDLVQKGETVYTPGIPRGGSKAVFAVNVLAINAGTLTIEVQHKNFSDNTEASWASVAGMTFTATGVSTVTASDLKEQVRLELTMSSGSSDWARVFAYDPSFEA